MFAESTSLSAATEESAMRLLCLVPVLASLLFVVGCKPDYEALPKSACAKIVERSKKLMGEGISDKSDAELFGVCNGSSPKQRGCAMVATSASDLMKCSLVKD